MADELDPSDLLKAAFSGDVNKVIALTNVSKSKRSLNKASRKARLNVKDKNGKTALHLAVDKNHTRAIQTLVHAGADINLMGTGDQGLLMTPLVYAVYTNKISCVRELLKLGADINCADSEGRIDSLPPFTQLKYCSSHDVDSGRTALMYAAQYHSVKILKTLLKAGADVHVKSYYGVTALHFAARFSNESVYVSKCIRVLLNYGADWFAETWDGETPLMVMQNSYKSMYKYQNQNPSYEYAKMLIHVGTNVNKIILKRQTLSIHTVGNDDLVSFLPILVEAVQYLKPAYEFVKMLIISGTDVNVSNLKGQTLLMYTARDDNLANFLPILVEAGAVFDQQDSRGMTALAHAVVFGSHKCVRWLLDAGTSVNMTDHSGETALEHAITARSYECARWLLDSGADVTKVDNEGHTVLMHAVRHYCLHDILYKLVEAGAVIDGQDSSGMTALAHAVSARSTRCVQWLLDSGADVMKVDSEGHTVLMNAARHEHLVELLPVLVKAGAVVDHKDSRGMTALSHAASKANHKCVRWLLGAGASVNTCDSSGKTPLHYLVSLKNTPLDIAQCLLVILRSKQVDVNAQDNDGMTPLMYASRLHYKDDKYVFLCLTEAIIIRLLLQHGADISLVDNLGQTALLHCVQVFLEADTRLYRQNIELLLDKGAYLYSGTLSVGKLSRLIELSCEIDGLLNLQVGDEVDLNVLWEEFLPVISKGRRKTLQFLIINKVMPSHSAAVGLRSRRRYYLYYATSVLGEALVSGHIGISKYLIATCYLCNIDLILSSARSAVCSQPWPLVKLCFVAVSTMFGASPGRQERVKNSQLPPKLQKMLLFQEPWSRLCVHQWHKIPLTFSWEKYEKLPRPRPLLYHWPVGRALVPCDCGECDGTMYKYEDEN